MRIISPSSLLSTRVRRGEALSIGLAIATLFQTWALIKLATIYTSIGTFLFVEQETTERVSKWVDQGGAWLAFLFAVVVLIGTISNFRKPLQPYTKRAFIAFPAVGISIWFALIALSETYIGGSFGARFSFFAYFARMGLPMITALILKPIYLEKLFGFAIAITFGAHGLEAIMGHPQFVDFILHTFHTVLHISLNESSARVLLTAIGILDIVAALSVFSPRLKKVLFWMALWGLATASVRITYFGLDRWAEFLIRISHFVLPLAFYFLQTPVNPHIDKN